MASFSTANDLDTAEHGSPQPHVEPRSRTSSGFSSEEGSSTKSSPKKKRGSIGSRMRSFYNYMTGTKSPQSGGGESPNKNKGGSERDDSLEDRMSSLSSAGGKHALADLPDPVLYGTSTFGSLTFNKNLALMLRLYLPEVMQIQAYKLVYSLFNHGTDLATFYKGAKGHDYTLILVETLDGSVFGGFCSREWKPVGSYFGTGESFVFSFEKKRTIRKEEKDNDADAGTDTDTDHGAVAVHRWTARNNYFCFADNDKIAMGGGGGGFGFVIDADFRTCSSSPCDTYGNAKSLDVTNSTGTPSRIANVELWAFVSDN